MMQINRETAKELVSTIKDPTPFFIETTKEFVDFALELNTHNRKTRKHHIVKFADDMCNGNWTPSCQGVGFSLDGWLIDGQHRLLANKASGYPPIPLLVVFGLPAVAQINVDNVVPRTTANMLELARGG